MPACLHCERALSAPLICPEKDLVSCHQCSSHHGGQHVYYPRHLMKGELCVNCHDSDTEATSGIICQHLGAQVKPLESELAEV